MEKVNGEYYLFTISWPNGSCRTEVVYRSKSLLSGYTGRVFLADNGVAQGGIFDTPEGKWYALLFRDSGPVGRMSHLVPMEWKDGWPVPTSGSKAPSTIDLPESPLPGYGMVTSDDFESSELALEWQFNHNPDNKNWSLTANPGFFRITTGRTDSRNSCLSCSSKGSHASCFPKFRTKHRYSPFPPYSLRRLILKRR